MSVRGIDDWITEYGPFAIWIALCIALFLNSLSDNEKDVI